MTTEEEIASYIYNTTDAYCWNCRYKDEIRDEEICKNYPHGCTHWEISMSDAKDLSREIMKLIREDEQYGISY